MGEDQRLILLSLAALPITFVPDFSSE